MMNFLKLLSNQAINNSQRIAYKIENDCITYGELWKRASEISKKLSLQSSDPVIIYGHKSVNMIVSIISCIMAKRTYIPIETGTPEIRIKKIIKLSSAKLLIKNAPIDIDDIECTTLDSIANNHEHSDEQIVNQNKIAYIIFTSGSTGEPKGVPTSYDNLDNFISWISSIEEMKMLTKAKVLNQASFCFDLSVADIFFSFANGHTLIGLSKQAQKNYTDIFNVIKREKINFIVMTPSFGKLLMLDHDFNSENYKELQCMYFCGEPLEPMMAKKLKKRFPDSDIINAYGPTEATSAVSAIAVTEDMLDKDYLPVGNINTSACEIKIENGEIILKGKSVFGGYLGNVSGGYFTENEVNCYKTGDCGYIKDDMLFCRGRKDNQVKYMGYRIELGDIESNLLKIDGVSQATVIAKYKSDCKTVKMIKAFIVVENNKEVSIIKSELSKLVPEYMIPKIITILDEMPLNEHGKIDRKSLEA